MLPSLRVSAAPARGFLIPLCLLLCVLLSACGFRLRQDTPWQADWQPLQVTAPDPVSALRQALELRLRQQDVRLVESEPRAVLAIRREILGRRVLSVDERARVSEYVLSLDVEYSFSVDGKDVVPPTTLQFSRDYDFDELEALGAAQEEALIANELRRDAVRRMLEQIGSSGGH